jgi:hypothetical protein
MVADPNYFAIDFYRAGGLPRPKRNSKLNARPSAAEHKADRP